MDVLILTCERFQGLFVEDVPTSTRMWEHLHTLYEIVMKTNNSLTVDSQLVVVFKGHFQNHQIPQGFQRSLVPSSSLISFTKKEISD